MNINYTSNEFNLPSSIFIPLQWYLSIIHQIWQPIDAIKWPYFLVDPRGKQRWVNIHESTVPSSQTCFHPPKYVLTQLFLDKKTVILQMFYIHFCEWKGFFIKISPKFVLMGWIENNPALPKKMAWPWIGNKPLFEAMLNWFTDVCGITGRWVNLQNIMKACICNDGVKKWGIDLNVVNYISGHIIKWSRACTMHCSNHRHLGVGLGYILTLTWLGAILYELISTMQWHPFIS